MDARVARPRPNGRNCPGGGRRMSNQIVTAADVNGAWLKKGTPLYLSIDDPLLEQNFIVPKVRGMLAVRIDVSGWETRSDYPDIIISCIAILVAASRYRTLLASQVTEEQNMFIKDFEKIAYTTIECIVEGKIDIASVLDTPVKVGTLSYFPDDTVEALFDLDLEF